MSDAEKLGIYGRAIVKWGVNPQILLAIEEMAELQKELCKVLNGRGVVDDFAIRDEIADVLIMMEQLSAIYGINNVQEQKEVKLLRLAKRLAE